MVRGHPSPRSLPFLPSASRSRRIQNEVVIERRGNGFPGPAVALDRPRVCLCFDLCFTLLGDLLFSVFDSVCLSVCLCLCDRRNTKNASFLSFDTIVRFLA